MTTSRSLSETGTPAPRIADLRGSFLQLAERFRAHEAAGLDARWVVVVDGHAPYTIHVNDSHCYVSAGRHPQAQATIGTDLQTWLDLVAGRRDGVGAFVANRLHVEGDLNLALRLGTLFRPGSETRRFLRNARVDAGGVDIEAIVAGRGTPVLLLHGLAASKVSFLPTIDGLRDDYQVHALDLPGFGKSSKPLPAGRRYSAAWMADVVRDYLRTTGIRSAHVVGNSMGGRIAVELALRHPRRVRSIVGLGPAVAFDEWQWLAPVMKMLRSQWLGLAPFPINRNLIEEGIAELFHDPSFLPQRNVRAAAEEFLRDIRDPRHRMAILACTRHLASERGSGRRSFWRRLEGLRVPSFWVWGSSDRLCSSRYCERVRQHVPGARCEVWQGVGHVPQFEVPQRTNAAIRGFLTDVDAGV